MNASGLATGMLISGAGYDELNTNHSFMGRKLGSQQGVSILTPWSNFRIKR